MYPFWIDLEITEATQLLAFVVAAFAWLVTVLSGHGARA